MAELHGVLRSENKAGKVGKGALLGFFGIGLACLGCCLAPVLGTLAIAGLGTSIIAFIHSHSMLTASVAGFLGIALVWFLKIGNRACCANPSADCSTKGCGIPARTTSEGKVDP